MHGAQAGDGIAEAFFESAVGDQIDRLATRGHIVQEPCREQKDTERSQILPAEFNAGSTPPFSESLRGQPRICF